MLGSDLGWSDCRGHIPNRHSVLPVRDSHRTNGPRMLGRGWRLLLRKPVQGSLHFCCAGPRDPACPPSQAPTFPCWVDEGTALHLERLGAVHVRHTRAAALALAEWLAPLQGLNLLCSRMGTQDPRRATGERPNVPGPKTGILPGSLQARACPASMPLPSADGSVGLAGVAAGSLLQAVPAPPSADYLPAGLPASPCPRPPLRLPSLPPSEGFTAWPLSPPRGHSTLSVSLGFMKTALQS